MNQIPVRPAEIKDALAIAKIHVGTWQCAYRGQMPDAILDTLSVEQRTTHWEKILSKPESETQTFVAETDHMIIGFCTVGPCRDNDTDKSTGELWSLYISPQHMNKGAGSALLTAGLGYLKKHEFQKATLWVLTSNEKTRKWYEKRGWSIEGKTKQDDKECFNLHETRYIFNTK